MIIGFLTPVYFLQAGALVSLPAIAGAFLGLILLFGGKILFKNFELFPFRPISEILN